MTGLAWVSLLIGVGYGVLMSIASVSLHRQLASITTSLASIAESLTVIADCHRHKS